jgi:hypothetical protein
VKLEEKKLGVAGELSFYGFLEYVRKAPPL